IAVLHGGKLIQLGTPIELLAHPADEFVSQLVGAENILRQLEYLPVTDALAAEPEVVSSAHRGDVPTCSSATTLLQAMLQLLQTAAPALAIEDNHTHEPLGFITLTSINHAISRVRQQAENVTTTRA
ncbi:MAG TPA: ABC transporter ATP-binding protein, partial [Ktedonobacteraceae bacterium]|nr:ABC transporter ATP-binding protein [Ktedonobacteraceae bacterium]